MADSESVAGSLKRTFGETGLSSDDEDVGQNRKRKKLLEKSRTKISSKISPVKKEAAQTTVLKKESSETTLSLYADSGYDQSVTNTPCSFTPLKSVQPSSSGYTSDRSENFTPRHLLFSPDWQQKGKKRFGHLGDPQHLKVFLRRSFSLLKDEIVSSGIADRLFAERLISSQNVESICEETSRREKCDILIKAICNTKEICDINSAVKVLTAFCAEGYEHLLKYSPQDDEVVIPDQPSLTSRDIKGRFYTYGRQLEDELSPLNIIDSLVDHDVLTLDEHQNIKEILFKPDKVKYLLKYILRKDIDKFWMFCKVLDSEYPVLADLLRQNGKNSTDPVPIVQTRKGTARFKLSWIKADTSSGRSPEFDGRTNVKFFFGDDGKEEEQMIVDDFNRDTDAHIQQKVMEVGYGISKIKVSCVCIELTSLCRQSQMYLIRKFQESPLFLQHWLKHLMSDSVIQRMKEKGVDTVSFEVKISLPESDSQSMCTCKITKEVIVKHFTILLEKMNFVDEIIDRFCSFEGFDETTKAEFVDMKRVGKDDISEKFLYKLLDLPDGGVHLCLLEKELREHGQEDLVRCLMHKEDNISGPSVTVKDIRGNMTLLLDEIEPRRFVNMLHGFRNSETIIERITSKDPRKDRCRDFLNFIMKVGPNAVNKFIPELERQGSYHIIESLTPKTNTEHDVLKVKEAVIVNYSSIVDEIEPRVLRQTFVDRKMIKAREFDTICKLPSRRMRANRLLLHVLEQDSDALFCLIDSMQVAGYRNLVNMIKAEMEKYTDCPRLFETFLKDKKAIKFRGEYKISYEPGTMTESPLQVYLHKLVYQGIKDEDSMDDSAEKFVLEADFDVDVVRKERTIQWVNGLENAICRKRLNTEPVSVSEGESKQQNQESDQSAVETSVSADDKFESCSTSVSYPSVGSFHTASPSTFSPLSSDDSQMENSPPRLGKKRKIVRRNSLSDESCRTLTSSSDESSKRGRALPNFTRKYLINGRYPSFDMRNNESVRSSNITSFFSSFTKRCELVPAVRKTADLMYSLLKLSHNKFLERKPSY